MWSFFSRDPAKGFSYEVGERVPGLELDNSIWSLHEGKHKSNGQAVSIFVFDVASNSETTKQTAFSSVKRLKTLRHPNVLSFIDSLETDKCIYMVTEHVKPLKLYLEEQEKSSQNNELAVSWGLHQIVKGVSFLLNSVNLIHNNVCLSSMFADAAGEWKLGGVDYMYPASGEGSNIPPIKTLPALEKYNPPEANSSGRSKKTAKWSSDMWGLGCLIWETFNGDLPRTSSLKVIGKIPKRLVRHYCELVSANPATRPSPDKFLANCKLPDAFMSNHFVQTNLFLEEIQIKEAHEKTAFFTDLTSHLDDFPADYSKHKVLPQLLNVFQFGSAGPSVLPPLFKLGKLLDSAQYQTQIVPCVIKLFSSTDRATRIQLLRQLPLFVEHLQPTVVNSQVFPNMVTGFMDTNPAIREQSVKGMLLLAPKLNDNNLNNELMKHFARLQSRDDQGPIRTNTTVCLGKMTQHLNPATRHKVISSAFARAMKDPFPAARIAGILAMSNNVHYFTTVDCATKALPSLCGLTVDPDKQVRENAFKTIKVFLEKLQTASDDPEKAQVMNQEAASTAQSTSPSAAGWTGWMSTGVTSLTSKLYTAKSNSATKPLAEEAKPASSSSQAPISNAKQAPIRDANDAVKSPAAKQNDWENNEWTAEDVKDDDSSRADVSSDVASFHTKQYTKKKKLVTSQQLRNMEEEIWHNLASNVKDDQEVAVVEDESYEGWNDNSWDASPLENEGAKETGWENDSWSVDLEPEPDAEVVEQDDGWGGGWDENNSSATTKTKMKPSKQSQMNSDRYTAASTYDWSNDAKSTHDSFFSSFDSKPKKTIDSQHSQKRTTKATVASAKSNAVAKAKEAPKPKGDGWGNEGWGDSGWGEDEDQGMTEAERMKKEREEKRKQRQKEIQERRAAKSTNKLGRKCD